MPSTESPRLSDFSWFYPFLIVIMAIMIVVGMAVVAAVLDME